MSQSIERGVGLYGELSVDTSYKTQDANERLSQVLEQVQLADQLWLDTIHLWQHHRRDYAISAPEIILAALSKLTQDIILSSGVSVISSADPVKLYQDFSLVDQLSNWRVEIMAGKWWFAESFSLFGYNVENYEALFNEKLNLLLQLRKGGNITRSGQFRHPLINQAIYPTSYQNRALPIWIALTNSRESVSRAAKLWLPITVGISDNNKNSIWTLIKQYKQEFIAAWHNADSIQIAGQVATFIMDNESQLKENYFPLYAAQQNKLRQISWWNPYTLNQFNETLDWDSVLCIGTPEQVRDKISKITKDYELTRFIAHMDMGAPSHDMIMESITHYSAITK